MQCGISEMNTACSWLPPRSLMAFTPKDAKGTVLTWMNLASSKQKVCSLLRRSGFGLAFHISSLHFLFESKGLYYWFLWCWNFLSAPMLIYENYWWETSVFFLYSCVYLYNYNGHANSSVRLHVSTFVLLTHRSNMFTMTMASMSDANIKKCAPNCIWGWWECHEFFRYLVIK